MVSKPPFCPRSDLEGVPKAFRKMERGEPLSFAFMVWGLVLSFCMNILWAEINKKQGIRKSAKKTPAIYCGRKTEKELGRSLAHAELWRKINKI